MNNTPTDITANKHGGNPESEAAHKKRKPTAKAQRERVYRAILAAGLDGMTVHELAEKWNVAPNQISGRFSELKADGRIEKVGARKNKNGNSGGVCVAVELMPQPALNLS
jgi:predicted Rossmann fold nucleotide-binding protein DprA/Smf involved in DNA uptake